MWFSRCSFPLPVSDVNGDSQLPEDAKAEQVGAPGGGGQHGNRLSSQLFSLRFTAGSLLRFYFRRSTGSPAEQIS